MKCLQLYGIKAGNYNKLVIVVICTIVLMLLIHFCKCLYGVKVSKNNFINTEIAN